MLEIQELHLGHYWYLLQIELEKQPDSQGLAWPLAQEKLMNRQLE
jgi:hypothetical protein